jgi:hypothetical protein
MTDALVAALNRAGFQPIFMPYTGVRPPELYNFTKRSTGAKLVRRGRLADYFSAPPDFEPTRSDLPDISHVRTTGKNLGSSADFLARCLACLGISNLPAIDLGFVGSSKLEFSLQGVHTLRVDPSVIDRAIEGLDPKAVAPEYVEQGFLHVAYEYAFARSITMRREDRRAFTSDIAGDLGGLIDVGTTVDVSAADEFSLRFKPKSARSAPAFAYKAGRLTRDTRWRFYPEEVRRGEDVAFPYVLRRGVVLDVEAFPSSDGHPG